MRLGKKQKADDDFLTPTPLPFKTSANKMKLCREEKICYQHPPPPSYQSGQSWIFPAYFVPCT